MNERLYKYLVNHASRGNAPVVDKMAGSTIQDSAAHTVLKVLEARSQIQRQNGKKRSYTLADACESSCTS